MSTTVCERDFATAIEATGSAPEPDPEGTQDIDLDGVADGKRLPPTKIQ
jgi:hypothetical protein